MAGAVPSSYLGTPDSPAFPEGKVPWIRRWLGDRQYLAIAVGEAAPTELLERYKAAFPEARIVRRKEDDEAFGVLPPVLTARTNARPPFRVSKVIGQLTGRLLHQRIFDPTPAGQQQNLRPLPRSPLQLWLGGTCLGEQFSDDCRFAVRIGLAIAGGRSQVTLRIGIATRRIRVAPPEDSGIRDSYPTANRPGRRRVRGRCGTLAQTREQIGGRPPTHHRLDRCSLPEGLLRSPVRSPFPALTRSRCPELAWQASQELQCFQCARCDTRKTTTLRPALCTRSNAWPQSGSCGERLTVSRCKPSMCCAAYSIVDEPMLNMSITPTTGSSYLRSCDCEHIFSATRIYCGGTWSVIQTPFSDSRNL